MIARNIRRIRQEKGWSQWQLSQAVGITPGAMLMIEHGARKCTGELIKAIANALGVSEADIRGSDNRR